MDEAKRMELAHAFRHRTEESRDLAFATRQRKRLEELHDDVRPTGKCAIAEETREMLVTRDA